jgi:2,4-didehydro-3-deoxy-L-rhamnonate hydrolase
MAYPSRGEIPTRVVRVGSKFGLRTAIARATIATPRLSAMGPLVPQPHWSLPAMTFGYPALAVHSARIHFEFRSVLSPAHELYSGSHQSRLGPRLRSTRPYAAPVGRALLRRSARARPIPKVRGNMKLLRYGPPGQESPGLLDASGTLRDLSGHVPDLGPVELAAGAINRLKRLDVSSLPQVPGNPRIGPPVSSVGKFVAIGLNYSDHAAESGMEIPKEPVIFMKAPSCLSGPDDPIMLPRDSVKTDYEVELGVVIGRTVRYVEPSKALESVAGYCVVNDVSEREYQLERGGTWDKGKGCDTFGPVGPWLVTPDEVGNPQDLSMWLDVNGRRKQTGSTRTMIFGVAELISYVSRFMALLPGDLITTGTPPGVGLGQKPNPIYLKPGNDVRLGIEKLGTQRQVVVPWRPAM